MTNTLKNVAIRIGLLLLVALAAIGCSNKQVYDAIQTSNRQECEKNLEYTREKCLEQVDVSYEEYEANRQATQADN